MVTASSKVTPSCLRLFYAAFLGDQPNRYCFRVATGELYYSSSHEATNQMKTPAGLSLAGVLVGS